MGLLNKKKVYDSKKNKSIIDSFSHAYDGIYYAITRERNMAIHITMAIMVIVFGALFSINYVEWLTCFILIGLVISLELINTAIEAAIDLITFENNELAKRAKDASAGAVLFISIISFIIGLIIFLPKIFDFILELMM